MCNFLNALLDELFRQHRLLLGLSPNDPILHSGTYGNKELSVLPIKFSSLHPHMYDQRLLPFTPRLHSFLSHAINMHEQRGQFPVYAETRRSLEEHLTWSMLKAQVACNKVSISIPNYTLALLPRLRYNVGGDGRPFPYQFLIFFSPSTKRIRGVRIGRVRAVLDAATNAAHAFSEGSGNWPVGDPIGISIDVTELSKDDNKLLAAYLAMGVPVEGELAKGFEGSGAFKPDSGSDDDALDYAQLDPAYEEHGFDADGVAMTQEQRQEAAADVYMEEIQGQEEEEHPMEEDPVLPYVQTESAAGAVFATSALQGSLEEPPSSTQPLLFTPTSTVESIPSSEAVSAASSSTPDVTLPRPRKSTVAARRSRNYRDLLLRHRHHVLVHPSHDNHPLRIDTLLPVTLRRELILLPTVNPTADLLCLVMVKSADGPHLLEEEACLLYRGLGLFKHGNSTGLCKTWTREFQHSYP